MHIQQQPRLKADLNDVTPLAETQVDLATIDRQSRRSWIEQIQAKRDADRAWAVASRRLRAGQGRSEAVLTPRG
jgi:hypothetical protein